MVYNCTPYMEYHPGGGDELMKSAGLIDFQMLHYLTATIQGDDGTALFHQVHRWVNLERILKPCLIGPYVKPPGVDAAKRNTLQLPM